MGIELILGTLGTAFALPLVWKLLDEFFRDSRAKREENKALHLTIDNHIDHNTKALNLLSDYTKNALIHMENMHNDTKETRKDLLNAIIKSTEASTTQTSTNKQMIKTTDRLEETVKALIEVVRIKN